MSLRRFQRGVRSLGGFAGGTSRLARPPVVLPEPDVRPTDGGTYTINATATATAGANVIQLDDATIVQTDTSRTIVWNFSNIQVPAGDYLGAIAHLEFTTARVNNEADLELFESDFVTFIDFDQTIANATTVEASVGPFTVPPAGGYVRMQYGTTDPNTLLASSYLQVSW